MASSSDALSDDDLIRLCDWENQTSPFATDSHRRFRKTCKKFVDKELIPYIDRWEKQGDIPKEVYKKCYEAGLYAHIYPEEFGGTPWEGDQNLTDPHLHFIWYEQMARAGSGGLITAIFCHAIAVPAVLTFGTTQQKEMMRPVICADKFAALAISEPSAGSDVRNIKTTARKEGDNYIVNGEKYWISGGMKADYFLTAVRTGGPGIAGISLLIIPRSKGVITTRLPLMGHHTSATAYVIFRDVRVPAANLVGAENQGFMPIMYNFNTERLGIVMETVSFARVCVDEAARYARSRVTFGKPLIKHQVIRHKLAEMARQVMSVYSFVERIGHQVALDPHGMSDKSIPRNVSLVKVQATKTLEFCAREAAQIFGGRSYVRGGRAGKIERIYRDVRAFAIYGGSEEILLDLAVRLSKL